MDTEKDEGGHRKEQRWQAIKKEVCKRASGPQSRYKTEWSTGPINNKEEEWSHC